LPTEKQFVFAFDGDRLVGALLLHFAKEGGSFAVVEPMHVATGYRSSGLGRRLWNMAADFARSQRATSIHVWAIDGNVGAIRFYNEKIGCKAVGKGEWRFEDHIEPAIEFQYDL
jgi:GNAT superfamily N-acetyltransferase